LNSLRTTVATPLKKPGRLLPSMTASSPLTSTNAPTCWLTSVVIPLGYRASTGGRNRAETSRSERAATSDASVRGYVDRSSVGEN